MGHFSRENPFNGLLVMIITAVVVTLAILYSERSGETETETIFGNPAFAKIYRPAGNEPFGCGLQACTWPVVRIGDERHFVAKIYKHNSTDALFSTEVKNMQQIGSREGYSNLIDAFGDKEHKNVLVMDFVAGKKVSKMLLKYDGQLVPKNVLVDMMTKMVERLAYLHDTAYLMHRDLHFDQWFIQTDNSLTLTDFGLGIVLGKDGFVPAGTNPAITGNLFNPICMSPEQAVWKLEPYSFNSDMWQLGCWFTQIASLDRTNCFQSISTDVIFGMSEFAEGEGENMFKNIVDYRQKLLLKTECRAMPAEYGSDFNNIIQWILTYDQTKRPQASDVLEALRKL